MRFVMVTGMSGAGKSTALKILEDEGYFCADNLPIPLVEKFADLAFTPEREYNKVALGVDIRSGREIADLQSVLERLDAKGLKYEILYLDARDDVLLKRFKETRRSHPLARNGRIEEGIQRERDALAFLRKQADYILDTSTLLTRELREAMAKILSIFRSIRTFLSQFSPLGSNTGYREIRILSLTCVSCPTLIMCRNSNTKPGRRGKSRNM